MPWALLVYYRFEAAAGSTHHCVGDLLPHSDPVRYRGLGYRDKSFTFRRITMQRCGSSTGTKRSHRVGTAKTLTATTETRLEPQRPLRDNDLSQHLGSLKGWAQELQSPGDIPAVFFSILFVISDWPFIGRFTRLTPAHRMPGHE